MGYDISIVRLDEASGKTRPITPGEWRHVVDTDMSLRVDAEDPQFVSWTGHPEGKDVCLHYHDDRVTAKNPDDAILGKMLQVSRRLEALVQGDDGEIYEAVGVDPRQPTAYPHAAQGDTGAEVMAPRWAGSEAAPPPAVEEDAGLAPGRWEGAYHYGKPFPGLLGQILDAPLRHSFTMHLISQGGHVQGTIVDKPSILGVCAGKARIEGTFDPGSATLSFTKTYLEGMFNTPVHYRGQVKNSRLVEGTWSFHASGEPSGGVWEAAWGGSSGNP